MGRGGAKTALGVAGLVWEAAEVCFGVGFVIEEGCWIGDWSLSRGAVLVVVAEGLIAWVAVERRGSGPPGLVSASVRGAGKSKLYLFWLCVSNIQAFNNGHCEIGSRDSRRERIWVVAAVVCHGKSIQSFRQPQLASISFCLQ